MKASERHKFAKAVDLNFPDLSTYDFALFGEIQGITFEASKKSISVCGSIDSIALKIGPRRLTI